MTVFKGEAQKLDSDDAKYFSANSEFLIKKYAAFYNALLVSLQKPLGHLAKSPLNEVDFQVEHGPEWVLCDGQDVTGSDYAILTGFTTVPDMITYYSYLTQSQTSPELGVTSEHGVAPHYHLMTRQDVGGLDTRVASGQNAVNRTLFGEMNGTTENTWGGNNTIEADIGTTEPMISTPSKPLSCATNYYIKVNND